MILEYNGFFGHNSGSRHVKRSIKGSKDADDRLVSTKSLSHKMAHCIGAQGQSKLVKISKTPPLVTSPKRTLNPNQIIFLKSKLEDFPNP